MLPKIPLLLLGAALSATWAPAAVPPIQDSGQTNGAGDPAAPATEDEPSTEKAEAWPEAANEAGLKKSCAKIRKASSEAMEAAGREEIVAEGAAAAPLLLKGLAREKKADARARLASALDLITTATHTRLLADSLDAKSDAERRYAMKRIASLGDPGLQERAESLLGDLHARLKDPKKAKSVDEDDVDLASILALSTGSAAGLERCLDLAGSKNWPSWRDALRAASTSARGAGDDVAKALVAALRPDPSKKVAATVAALRLIAYAGGEGHARSVIPALDDTANHVKVAAVNALRMMVDGAEPLDKLSTFDAIERANKWKSRL